MSTAFKIIVLAVVIIILIALIWQGFSLLSSTEGINNSNRQNIATQNQDAQPAGAFLTSPNDTSDSALSKDILSLDSQIKIFDNYSSAADLSLNQNAPTIFETAQGISTIVNTADSEINQKLQDLNSILLAIKTMQKISLEQKTSLSQSAQKEIDDLNLLKTKIDSETNSASAQTDYKEIIKSFQLFYFVSPKIRIMAAADKALSVVDLMNVLKIKIQSRILKLNGANGENLNLALANFSSEVNDAKLNADKANSLATGLLPDQGDPLKMQTNVAALNVAKSSIDAVSTGFISARTSAGSLAQTLKEISPSAAGSQKPTLRPAPKK